MRVIWVRSVKVLRFSVAQKRCEDDALYYCSSQLVLEGIC